MFGNVFCDIHWDFFLLFLVNLTPITRWTIWAIRFFLWIWLFYGTDECYIHDENAPWYVSRPWKEWYHDIKVKMLLWLAYNPNQNPVEYLWDELEWRLRTKEPCQNLQLRWGHFCSRNGQQEIVYLLYLWIILELNHIFFPLYHYILLSIPIL